jgi:DnaJ-class molecular chaperone
VTAPCPACEGHGFFTCEPEGWWHGSGVNVVETECPVCAGTGEAPADDAP